jgi:hypothetical protein
LLCVIFEPWYSQRLRTELLQAAKLKLYFILQLN